MKKYDDNIIGKTFGKYKVISFDHCSKTGTEYYKCFCNKCEHTTIVSLPVIYESLEKDAKCVHTIIYPEEVIGRMFGKYKALRILDNGKFTASTILVEAECTVCGYKRSIYLDRLRGKALYSDLVCQHDLPWPEKRLSRIYADIIRRCEDPTATHYEYYGGKGIKMDQEWLKYKGQLNFIQFAEDHGYTPGCELTIDRLDPNKNYGPNNCQWVSKTYNTTFAEGNSNFRLKYPGFDKMLPIQKWAKLIGKGMGFYSFKYPTRIYANPESRALLIAEDVLKRLSDNMKNNNGMEIPGAMYMYETKPIGDFNENGEFVYKENCDPLQLIIDKEEKGDFDFDLSKLRKDNDDDNKD